MKNLVKSYNNDIFEDSENLYLYFSLGECQYAVNVRQVVEVMKLPLLDYPQKLADNILGLLNYNNFTINVLDIRFYLNIKVTPYSLSNQLLIVKTDETIFGLLIDKVEDIVLLDSARTEHFAFQGEHKIIDFLCQKDEKTISVLDLSAIENILKTGVNVEDVDIPALFPHDDESRYKLIQRNQALQEKFQLDLSVNMFAQDKFISFTLENVDYCMNLEYVKEFLKNAQITKIPCNLDYISGIVTMRGDFITVIDTKKFLNLEAETSSVSQSSIIIVETPEIKMGFLVDKINSIMEIPEELIDKNYYKQHKYIQNEVVIEDKLYLILDMKSVLADEKFFVEE